MQIRPPREPAPLYQESRHDLGCAGFQSVIANPLSPDPVVPSPVLPYCCVRTLWITGDGDKSRGRWCVRAVATLTASGLPRRENMIFQTMICSGGMAARPRCGKRDVYDGITIIPDTMHKLCSA